MSLAFDGHELLKVTVGMTWFEIFPFDLASLDHLRGIVRAVMAGRIEEARTWGESFARLYTDGGTLHVGHVHLPWPWRWRPVRRYEPYGGHGTSAQDQRGRGRVPVGSSRPRGCSRRCRRRRSGRGNG